MLFTEFQFIFYFLPITLAVFALLPRQNERLLFIFLASLFFYGFWDIRFLPLLVGSITFNWWLGEKIEDSQDDRRRKRLTTLAVVCALLPLAYFKYSLFVSKSIGLDFGYKDILPLGISFYTFQQITYIVNIYKRRFPASRSFLKYAFIVTFFPHLIAGPILFYKDIVGQIGQVVDRNRFFAEGIVYFIIGFIKKFFIADNIALLATPVFTAAGKDVVTGAQAITGTLGYTLQLYFDFSGYSDMAVGLGLMFGYRLPMNFNSPYQALSISDFWRRWHMTLSNFLRDYVYIPLGGNQKGAVRRYINLFLTMLIGGLWHGANWTFVVWGGVHGLALAVNHAFSATKIRLPRAASWALTFTFAALAWVLFRAESFDTAMNVYKGFFNGGYTFTWQNAYLWPIAGMVLIFLPNSHKIAEKLPEWWMSRGTYLRQFMERRAILYIILSQLIWYPVIAAFYQHAIDKKLYAALPVERYEYGVRNDIGDFRSNLFTNDIFSGNERKVIIAGSSYTMKLGTFYFDIHGKPFKSATIGMGGNNVFVPLRSAYSVLDTPNLDTLVIALSALNMNEVKNKKARTVHANQTSYAGAFPYECVDGLKEQGFPYKARWFGSCTTLDTSFTFAKKIALITIPGSDIFFQFHSFLSIVLNAWAFPAPQPEKNDLVISKEADMSFHERLNTWKKEAENQTTPSSRNGEDAKFHWLNRKTTNVLLPNGEVYQTLRDIKQKADHLGVHLVLYTTPTVSHKNAPWVYPEGYLENYQTQLHKMAADLGITLYDYTDFLPWSSNTMADFIHPTKEAAQLLHQDLLYKLYRDGILK